MLALAVITEWDGEAELSKKVLAKPIGLAVSQLLKVMAEAAKGKNQPILTVMSCSPWGGLAK